MADNNQPNSAHTQRAPKPTSTSTCAFSATFLRTLHRHSPTPTQLFALFTLLTLAFATLFLAGLTFAGALLALVLLTPFIILSSPLWLPPTLLLFLVTAAFLSICGCVAVAVAASSWMYRYFRGLHPPGSDRVDYARSRIYDTASHVKECAYEYGGFLQGKGWHLSPIRIDFCHTPPSPHSSPPDSTSSSAFFIFWWCPNGSALLLMLLSSFFGRASADFLGDDLSSSSLVGLLPVARLASRASIAETPTRKPGEWRFGVMESGVKTMAL
ncbi:oleosin 1 [Senna tora]|uniref:Oleosin 1 n=1 Tax=Senna tora TaxID=362788 RepID=A0A834SN66_9FABA|nr:oleosin 1 [Senna tora]